jgi:hypothetical protein
MQQIIITYRLKPHITPEVFETWVRETDYPTMRTLPRVRRFETYRSVKQLLSEDAPTYMYTEVFDIEDMPGFIQEDLPGPVVQGVMAQFMQYVERPEFVIAEAVA